MQSSAEAADEFRWSGMIAASLGIFLGVQVCIVLAGVSLQKIIGPLLADLLGYALLPMYGPPRSLPNQLLEGGAWTVGAGLVSAALAGGYWRTVLAWRDVVPWTIASVGGAVLVVGIWSVVTYWRDSEAQSVVITASERTLYAVALEAVSGAVIGAAQWAILRRKLRGTARWIAAMLATWGCSCLVLLPALLHFVQT